MLNFFEHFLWSELEKLIFLFLAFRQEIFTEFKSKNMGIKKII